MQKSKRALLVGLAVALVACGGYVVYDRVNDDGPVKKTEVVLPQSPYDSGKDEPRKTRVYVDNSGPTVSVSVRTATKPWTDQLSVTVNGRTTELRRGRIPLGGCAPHVVAEPTSMLTRLDFDRTCVKKSADLKVSVAVDGAGPVRATAAETAKPNVLMIMVDDMRADDLRYMPNVQKLIGKQGVNFTNAFASFPLCCPARASVMSGQYPHNHGVWSHDPPWGFPSFDDAETFPVWLTAAGYRTTYLGKYLNGYGSQPEPGRTTGTSTQYVPQGWALWNGSIDGGLSPSDPDDGGTYRYWDTTLNNNGDGYISLKGKYQTNAYADMTNEMVSESAAADDPFFHYVSFTAPHHGGPHESDDPPDVKTPARPKRMRGAFDDIIKKAPGATWKDPDRQADKPKRLQGHPSKDKMKQVLQLTRQRAESLYVVDGAVKRMIANLKKTGKLDNTVVVFTSDNGYFLGEQGIPTGKVLPYEPSLRVPLLMRGPGIPKGEVRTDPFLSIDYASTFSDLGDAKVGPAVDGRSMLDVVRLGDETSGDSWSRVVLTETTPTNAVRDALAAKQPVGARTAEMMLGKVTGIRTGQYLYTEWQAEPGDPKSNIRQELYDVRGDPNEYENLALDPKQESLLAEFHKILVRARTCVGPECEFLLPRNLR
ncbi:sulfatase-like hydrolase/transferase [Nocardioides sp. Root151]|uniref:sulfatase-like hydrolase/transferase n=1 Tax=Nocardioides sp. Root151 TaxID=1736475 RepID=UPI0007023F78|nr:sulfatase-like hydrolase/transferase [Nocardioides sp. Root151]KQZ70115.1 hypothetical protein ASD66_10640 [Nocardioides sp. Root151]